MSAYEDFGRHVLKHGVKSSDRTGVGTLRITGHQMRFNLQEGFPMVTSKQVSFAYIARELEWLVKGNTSQTYLKNNLKCSIWDEWADEFGRLGPIYGAMWRRRPSANIEMIEVPVDMRIGECINEQRAEKILSSTANTRKYFYGNPAYEAWRRMIRLAASSNKKLSTDKSIPEQVQRVTVCKEWLQFTNFLTDFYSLPGCELVQVDNADSWLLHTSNEGRGLFAKDTLQIIESYKHSLLAVAGALTAEKRAEGIYDKVVTPRFYIDQLADAIEQIKTNPDSRRIIVDSWEPSLLPQSGVGPSKQAGQGRMALAPCHCMFQFTVLPQKSGPAKLDLTLLQRSADTVLGVPYNIASYALLLHIVALECGLVAGDFVWNGIDCHVYQNHVDKFRNQLRRKTHPLPKLVIDPSVKSLKDFKASLVKLEGYVHGPKTDYPVAV